MPHLQRSILRHARPLTWLAGGAALLLASCHTVPPAQHSSPKQSWVATWASSPSLPMGGNSAPPGMRAPELEGTVRYLLRVSAGGEKVRIVLDGGPSIDRLSIGAAPSLCLAVDEVGGEVSPLEDAGPGSSALSQASRERARNSTPKCCNRIPLTALGLLLRGTFCHGESVSGKGSTVAKGRPPRTR